MYIHNLKVSGTRARRRACVLYKRNWRHIFILKGVFHFHRMRWAGHVGRTEMRTGEYRGVVGKRVVKRPLERLGIDGRKYYN